MHVLHGRGRFWVQRERFWRRVLLGAGLVSLAGFGLVPDPLLLVAILSGAALFAAQAMRKLRRIRRVRTRQWQVVRLLRGLPDDYYLVNHVVLGRRRVDHVLLGPCGIVVMETRNIRGLVAVDRHRWYVHGRRRRRLGRRAFVGAAALQTALREWIPGEAETAARYVEPLVLLTHPSCRLRAQRPAVLVIRQHELPIVLADLGRKHRMPPALARHVAGALVSPGRAQGAPGAAPGAGRHFPPALAP
ncbi:MAG TPA: nuclease-related domain-containing protein [Methylomirabilota bacterium]|nr:nuclease-related domain-containing protein [Methylomirabilota bacterium]